MSNPTSYNGVAKIFHWGMAIIMIGLLAVGFWMVQLAYSPFKFEIYNWHKAFGLLIMFAVGLRLMWRALSPSPAHLSHHKPWERVLSGVSHLVMYGAFLLMPISGWVMSSAGGYPVLFFGIAMPDLMEKNELMYERAQLAHEVIAYVFSAFLALHIAGALKHHVIDKDETLKRMLVRGIPKILVPLSVLVYAVPLAVAAYFGGTQLVDNVRNMGATAVKIESAEPSSDISVISDVQAWQIIPEESHIRFEATQYGAPLTGHFETFTGAIAFDLDNLDNSAARIEVDITSINTGSRDRDGQARSDEWFDSGGFPTAIYEVTKFESLDESEGANRYQSHGALTLRGVTKDVNFPFTLIMDGEQARMSAQLDLDRTLFGVGQGQWVSGDTIGTSVQISLQVSARKKQ